MRVLIDADACPGVIRDILARAAERTGRPMLFFANQPLHLPPSRHIEFCQVASGADVADKEILRRVAAGDLVITSDIPLAAEVIEKGGRVLGFRGEVLDSDNIGARLNMRDFLESMRGSGLQSGGPPPLKPSDRQQFANRLDTWLRRESTAER